MGNAKRVHYANKYIKHVESRTRHMRCTCVRPGREESASTSPAGIAPDDYDTWPNTAPPPRRMLVGAATATGIALGGNLGGITSFLAGLDDGRIAAALRLDAVLPVRGFKRCLGQGYEFVYPADWLADVTLYKRRVASAELARGLSFSSVEEQERVGRRKGVVEPAVAYGPRGGAGEENVSVISAPAPSLRLEDLGGPSGVGERLMAQIAPAGSSKEGELISGDERRHDGIVYYIVEYRVRRRDPPTWVRHNVAVLAAADDVLYTLNAQCNESDWTSYSVQYHRIAASFRLSSSGALA